MSQVLESPKDYVLRILKTYPRLNLTFRNGIVDVNAITDNYILEQLANRVRGLQPEQCQSSVPIDKIRLNGRSLYSVATERANHELYVNKKRNTK